MNETFLSRFSRNSEVTIPGYKYWINDNMEGVMTLTCLKSKNKDCKQTKMPPNPPTGWNFINTMSLCRRLIVIVHAVHLLIIYQLLPRKHLVRRLPKTSEANTLKFQEKNVSLELLHRRWCMLICHSVKIYVKF